ncbi:hypothetical protein ACI65C_006921 [Semiaphis heraclei]
MELLEVAGVDKRAGCIMLFTLLVLQLLIVLFCARFVVGVVGISYVRGYIVRILFFFHSSSSNLSTQQSDFEAADCSIEADIDVGVNEFSDEESPVSPGCSYAGKRVRSKTDKLNVLLAKRAKDRNTIIETIEKQNEKILNLHNTEEDDVDFFFKSLAITIKKLPNKGINEVKIKSLALVTEIEEKYSAPEQPRITSVVPDQTNYYQLSSLQAVSDSAVLYPMSSNYSGFGNYHNNHGEQKYRFIILGVKISLKIVLQLIIAEIISEASRLLFRYELVD